MADLNKAIRTSTRSYTQCLQQPKVSSIVRQGQYDLAMADYNKALDVDPKYTLAYINRGFSIVIWD